MLNTPHQNHIKDKEKLYLANEWNLCPVMILTMAGEITYLNLAMRTQFPKLQRMGIKHPLLIGLIEEINQFNSDINEATIFVKEINYMNHIYQLQIFSLSKIDAIFIYTLDITKDMQTEKEVMAINEKFEKFRSDSEQKSLDLQNKIEKAYATHRKLKEQLDFAMNSAGVGTWSWDVICDIVIWDGHMSELFGLETKKYTLKHTQVMELIHPDDRKILIKSTRISKNMRNIFHIIFRTIHPDKSIHYLEAKGRMYTDNFGQPKRIAGICFEIDPKN